MLHGILFHVVELEGLNCYWVLFKRLFDHVLNGTAYMNLVLQKLGRAKLVHI